MVGPTPLLQGDNDNTEMLLRRLNSSGKVHMVPASFKGKYVIRFTVTSQYTREADIERDWVIIQEMARKVRTRLQSEGRPTISLWGGGQNFL